MPPNQLFVTGTTRAGTTMFRLMLGQHPDVVELGEFEFVFRAGLPDDGPADAGALDAWRAWLRDRRNVRHGDLRLPNDAGFRETIVSLLEQRREQLDPRAPVVVVVWHRDYEKVRRLFPEARFLHLTRDPRDVIASWLKFGWVGNGWAGAREWRTLQREWLAVRGRIPEDRWMELRFEDLVAAPEERLREVAAFAGFDYDDAMLRFHEHSTYEPLDPSQAHKWRGRMDPRTVRVIEAVLGADVERWGYTRSTAAGALPPWEQRAWWLDARVRKQVYKVRRFGPRLWLRQLVARRLGLRELQRQADIEMGDVVQRSVK